MESVKNLVIATLVTVAVGITFAGCGAKKEEVKAEETPAETEVKTEETKVEETKTEEVKAE